MDWSLEYVAGSHIEMLLGQVCRLLETCEDFINAGLGVADIGKAISSRDVAKSMRLCHLAIGSFTW